MAPKRSLSKHQLPHIRIDQFRRENVYSPPPRAIPQRGPRRDNVNHGRALSQQFSAAYARARAVVAARRAIARQPAPGFYIEVASAKNESLGDLTWEQKGIRLGALRLDDNDIQRAAVFV